MRRRYSMAMALVSVVPLNNIGDVTDFGWGCAVASYLFVDREDAITVLYAQHVLNSPVKDLGQQIRPIMQEVLV